MNKSKQLAAHEINWWKAHHRRQKDMLLKEMSLLYELLFNLPQEDAMKAVIYRVDAAHWHDLAERFEDEGDTAKSEENWNLAEEALQRHFEILLKFIEKKAESK